MGIAVRRHHPLVHQRQQLTSHGFIGRLGDSSLVLVEAMVSGVRRDPGAAARGDRCALEDLAEQDTYEEGLAAFVDGLLARYSATS